MTDRAWRRRSSRRCRSRSWASSSSIPVVSILALGSGAGRQPRHRRGARRAGPAVRARRRLVHALAGGAVDAADRAHRVARRVRLRALRLPRPAAASAPCRSCRSCCPRWWSRRRSWHCWGRASPFGVRLDHTIFAILAAHVFYNYAVVLRIVGGVWAQIDPRLEDAARVLGASRWQAFRRVTSAAAPTRDRVGGVRRVPVHASRFGVILMLGGSQYSTLEVEIYRQTAELLDLRTAAVAVAPPDDGARRPALAVLALPAAQRDQPAPLTRGAVARRPRDARRASARRRATSAVMAVVPGPAAGRARRALARRTERLRPRELPGVVRNDPRSRRCSCRRSRRSRTRSSSRRSRH